MHEEPLFTVLTATFNRRDTLARAFQSLERQTISDIEWVIVDDGSTDGTEIEVARFAKAARFPVIFLRQSNLGKYRAWNAGVRAASAPFIANLDSDDAFLPEALERLYRAWNKIAVELRGDFVGVTGLCLDEHGRLVGDRFPASPFDSDSATAALGYGIKGDKAGFVRRDVALAHLFPEHLPTRFIPEGRIWLDIARSFRTRFINEPILSIHDSGSGRLSRLARPQRAHGDLEFNRFALDHFGAKYPGKGLKAAVLMTRAGLALGHSARTLIGLPASRIGKIATAIGYPFAAVLSRCDLARAHGALGILISITRSLPPRLRFDPPSALFVRLFQRSSDREVEINVLSFRMRLDLFDPSHRMILLFPRSPITPEMRHIREALSADGTFVDIGADEGFRTLYMSRYLKQGRVIAVEVDPVRRNRLERNIALSCADNVEVRSDLAWLGAARVDQSFGSGVAIRVSDRAATDVTQTDLLNLAKVTPDLVLLPTRGVTERWHRPEGFREQTKGRSERLWERAASQGL